MLRTKWFTNPVTVFIFSLVALGTSLYLYIQSYLEVNNMLSDFVRKKNLDSSQFLEPQTWIMILVLSILVTVILICLVIIFVYYQKVIQLYRMQQNFINGFTHELKTPLASLRLFLDTFLKHELPRDEQMKYLTFMKRDTDRLVDNVNLILNLAKIEEKKYQTNFKQVDLAILSRQWLQKVSFVNEEGKVNIHSDGIVEAVVDPDLFEMVLMNLVGNALHHNHEVDKKVDIHLISDKEWIALDVIDNGPGIPAKEKNKVFKKFYQIGKSSKGSGIGLYTVFQIIKLHKGKITVEDGPNHRGTKMAVLIPKNLKEIKKK
ncbi:MAG: two-component sensor histidine kinase [Bdellovibrio sp. CG12_big_fil_rev_8_21_14_0_65_39_13]|nr:MAG: two-component sensor histidine kinase [Bdellovibrio sp. CG22_combo_CG10-13_8_21_14_all_39_27]PIQ58932.1 MAG: two-component sensor histidine kinase [Bdellovibrio sp. CG12_big_fil_rev_8_21_14_0_65_39_13]PIR36021.1 MAG: two-component sensor histidine kinase [Bdellovibrio sp. CG11_big_fil_rev_8_21_14_0_20_39_38]